MHARTHMDSDERLFVIKFLKRFSVNLRLIDDDLLYIFFSHFVVVVFLIGYGGLDWFLREYYRLHLWVRSGKVHRFSIHNFRPSRLSIPVGLQELLFLRPLLIFKVASFPCCPDIRLITFLCFFYERPHLIATSFWSDTNYTI